MWVWCIPCRGVVARWYCPRVRSTVSALPDCLAARRKGTLEALEAMSEAGLVDEKQYNTLRLAYLFYREIENRSQIYQDRSDPRIPRDVSKARPLARGLGYSNDDKGTQKFLDKVTSTRQAVRQTYEDVVASLRAELQGAGTTA